MSKRNKAVTRMAMLQEIFGKKTSRYSGILEQTRTTIEEYITDVFSTN